MAWSNRGDACTLNAATQAFQAARSAYQALEHQVKELVLELQVQQQQQEALVAVSEAMATINLTSTYAACWGLALHRHAV
jgi:hypothetical protein